MAFPLVLIPELIGDVAGLADWGLGLAGVPRENQWRRWLDVADELGLINSIAEMVFPGATTTAQTPGEEMAGYAATMLGMMTPTGAASGLIKGATKGPKMLKAIPALTKAYHTGMWAKPWVQVGADVIGGGEGEPMAGEIPPGAAPPPAQPVPPAGQPAGGQPQGVVPPVARISPVDMIAEALIQSMQQRPTIHEANLAAWMMDAERRRSADQLLERSKREAEQRRLGMRQQDLNAINALAERVIEPYSALGEIIARG